LGEDGRVIAQRELEHAVAILRRGGLVAFPTETVYGLGADASSARALARLYAVKQRPADHPVIVHVADASALDDWAQEIGPAARALADACWPGPLTLVIQRAPHVLDAVTGGNETVGVRVPDQRVALALLHAFGGGLAVPSANRFGLVSPTRADDVKADLAGDVDLVLDDGPCAVGVESTIVDCSGPKPAILRLGAVTQEQVEAITRGPVDLLVDGEVAAPGTRPGHYAPSAAVVVVAGEELVRRVAGLAERGLRVGLLTLSPPGSVPGGVVVLDSPRDVDEYARVLYERLREADRYGLDVVVAVPPTDRGIGAAVADRLRRAAAGSPL
jgi:L-threonylcarbamoyladenylate synthase